MLGENETCDDGNIQDSDGCSAQCRQEFIVFASDILYTADLTPTDHMDLSGLDRADANCQDLAANASLPGQYSAWLSDGQEGPSKRFGLTGFTGNFVLADGTLLAEGWPDLIDAELITGIGRDQYGEVLNPGRVWTHTSTDGTPYNDNPCSHWTGTGILQNARTGAMSSKSAGWTSADDYTCENSARIYCFQIAE